MPEAGRRLLHIGVARDAVSVALSGGWLRRQLLAQAAHVWPVDARPTPAQVGAQLALLLARMPGVVPGSGLRCDVVLDDDLVRHWTTTPPANARSLADCRMAAQARFLELYGKAIDGDSADTGWHWDADWRADRPFLASAVPRPWMRMLQQAADDHGLRLQAVTPLLVAAWNRWRRALHPQAWFAVVADRRITLAATTGGALQGVGRLQLPVGTTPATGDGMRWLHQAVQREALRWALDAPARLQWCGGAAPRTDQVSTNMTDWPCTPLPTAAPVAACLASVPETQRGAVALALAGW